MKKNDFYIIAAVILAVILSAVLSLFVFSKNGENVVIKQNNEVVFTGSIKVDKTIPLEHNTVVIDGGFVYVESADCKNQICVNHKKISKKGESITCLPNKVLVEVE